jgi:DNA-binding XRE family transcriptional regulator
VEYPTQAVIKRELIRNTPRRENRHRRTCGSRARCFSGRCCYPRCLWIAAVCQAAAMTQNRVNDSDKGDSLAVSSIRRILAVNVRRERRNAGFTQERLAEAAGLPRVTIVRIEKGDREPRVSTLVRIAVALEAPLARLLIGLPASETCLGRDAIDS